MLDKRFFELHGPFTLAELVDGTVATVDDERAQKKISCVGVLDHAGSDDITFFHNVKYIDMLPNLKAGACIIAKEYANRLPADTVPVISDKPYRAFAQISCKFFGERLKSAKIESSASIDPSAKIGKDCYIGQNVVIEENVEIGDGCQIDHGAIIHRGVQIGANSRIDANVTISHAIIGQQALIKSGARIGQKGFGFDIDEQGHLTVPQVGRVVIEDDVEIGANTTVDRGSSLDTTIGQGSRLDNCIHIGHNVKIGRGCVIVSQVGVAGSAQIGNNVVIAGQSAIGGHIKIGDGCQIAARSGVMRDVEAGSKIAGAPAIPIKDWHRETVAIAKLAKTRGYKKA